MLHHYRWRGVPKHLRQWGLRDSLNWRRIDTVVLDVGGVLFADANEPKIADLAACYGAESERLRDTVRRLRPGVDLGTRTEREFWRAVVEAAGAVPTEADLDFTAYIAPMPGAFEAVSTLAARYRLAILSNDSRELSKARRAQLPVRIDDVVISAEVGVMKPDESIYRILLDRLEVPAEKTLFLDDRIENVDAARLVGMHAVHFTSWSEVFPVLAGP